MRLDQIAVALAVDLVLLATIAGLITRSRWRLCVGFAVYVPVGLAYNLLMVLWPERFYKPWFWIAGHEMFDALKLWTALEVGWRSFRGASGVSAAARRTAVVVLGVIVLVTTAARVDQSGRALCLMVAILALARGYRVRLHPFHAGVLKGFVAYLAVFGPLTYVAEAYGWRFLSHLASLEPAAHMVVTWWWLYIAWRRQPQPAPPQLGPIPSAPHTDEAPSPGERAATCRLCALEASC